MSERNFTRSMTADELENMLSEIEWAIGRIRQSLDEFDLRPNFAELIRGAADAMENYIHHERQRH